MSPRFTLVEAKPWHCGQIIRRLRAAHIAAIAGSGLNPHRELRRLFDQSAYRVSWFVDDQLAAIGGLTGGFVNSYGMIWMAMSDLAAQYPLALIRMVRGELDMLMEAHNELATLIIPKDDAALRFSIFLGFHISDSGFGAPGYSRFGRRRLHDHVTTGGVEMLNVGSVQVIPMGYHREVE